MAHALSLSTDDQPGSSKQAIKRDEATDNLAEALSVNIPPASESVSPSKKSKSGSESSKIIDAIDSMPQMKFTKATPPIHWSQRQRVLFVNSVMDNDDRDRYYRAEYAMGFDLSPEADMARVPVSYDRIGPETKRITCRWIHIPKPGENPIETELNEIDYCQETNGSLIVEGCVIPNSDWKPIARVIARDDAWFAELLARTDIEQSWKSISTPPVVQVQAIDEPRQVQDLHTPLPGAYVVQLEYDDLTAGQLQDSDDYTDAEEYDKEQYMHFVRNQKPQFRNHVQTDADLIDLFSEEDQEVDLLQRQLNGSDPNTSLFIDPNQFPTYMAERGQEGRDLVSGIKEKTALRIGM